MVFVGQISYSFKKQGFWSHQMVNVISEKLVCERRQNLEHLAKLLTDEIFLPMNLLTDENI